VPRGTTGHTTLLTTLANRVQPLIRFDIGDRIRLPQRACECGSGLPLIEVEGRVDDTLVFDDALGEPVSLLPLAVHTASAGGAPAGKTSACDTSVGAAPQGSSGTTSLIFDISMSLALIRA
jgi:hypothetical protein